MEKNKIGSFLAGAGNAAKGTFDKVKEKTIHVVDQNDDGKFDIDDVSVVAGAVSDVMKKGAAAVKVSAEENRKRMELKSLQPIFADTLDQADFFMSKLIRVVERDRKHAESDVCKGSIGFLSDKGGLRVVNLFTDSLDVFGLTFYPDADGEFYYVNPTDRDNYIALNEYFSYLKTVRINELQRVAQDLGARHSRVIFKEEQATFSQTKDKKQAKLAAAGSGEIEQEREEKKYATVDVAAEMFMDGHEPREPELVYLLKDDNVRTLIHLRMAGGERFHHHKLSIKMSSSSGIRESDAAKIDAVLKGMKVIGNTTWVSEVRNESRRYLEYEIDF